MQAGDLIAELTDSEHMLVVAQDLDTDKIYTIKAARHEWDPDSTTGTIFLEIEES